MFNIVLDISTHVNSGSQNQKRGRFLYCLHHILYLIFMLIFRFLAEDLLFFANVSENFCVHQMYKTTCVQYFGVYRWAFAGFIGHFLLGLLAITRDSASSFFLGTQPFLMSLIILDINFYLK